MRLNKSKRLIAISILFVALLVLPILYGVYYTILYYAGLILSIAFAIYKIIWDEKVEERFYKRWHKARQQGFWINVVREGLFSFVQITVLVSISQLFGNGRTPLDILPYLSGSILLLILAFSLTIGTVAQYENEKRYQQIYYSMKNNNR